MKKDSRDQANDHTPRSEFKYHQRLIGNIGSLLTLQGANYLLPLITLPYLVRVLGPGKFGLISFAQAFIQYFIVLTDYGFNLSATRGVAVAQDNPSEVAKIVGAVMSIKVALMLFGALVLTAFVLLFPVFQRDWPLYAVVYMSVAGSVFFPTWLFQGLECMKYITWMNVASRLLTTGAILVFVHQRSDFILAAAIQSTTLIVAALPAWPVLYVIGGVRWRWPGISSISNQFRDGWHFFLSTAAISVYTSTNTFLLGLLVGPSAVGYFSAANKLIQAAQGLMNPFSQALYPHISRLVTRSRVEALNFIRLVLKYSAAGSLLLSIVLFLFSRPLVNFVLGNQYGPSITLLRWMAFLPFIISFSNVFGIQTMLTFGMAKTFGRILIMSAAINLVLIVPLISCLAGQGAAITLLSTESFVSVAMGWVLHQRGYALFRKAKEE